MEDNNTILDVLTDEDVEYISNLALAEDEIASIINLLELIQSDNKDKAINIIKMLFNNKKLVDANITAEDTETTDAETTTDDTEVADDAETVDDIDDTEEVETEIIDESCVPVSERYTRILLGEH